MCKKLIPFYTLLLITMPVYAVKNYNYKISNYGDAHQIWFEAEDYDERNPDTDQYYPVVDAADAFGQAITRAGGAGGMIRWTFDIRAADGKAGTWYFWARVLNPDNQSDYMLVAPPSQEVTAHRHSLMMMTESLSERMRLGPGGEMTKEAPKSFKMARTRCTSFTGKRIIPCSGMSSCGRTALTMCPPTRIIKMPR